MLVKEWHIKSTSPCPAKIGDSNSSYLHHFIDIAEAYDLLYIFSYLIINVVWKLHFYYQK